MSNSTSLNPYVTDESYGKNSCTHKSDSKNFVPEDHNSLRRSIHGEDKRHLPHVASHTLHDKEMQICLPGSTISTLDDQNSKIISYTKEESRNISECPIITSPTLTLHFDSKIQNEDTASAKSSENTNYSKTYLLENKSVDKMSENQECLKREKVISDGSFFENLFSSQKTEEFGLPKSNSFQIISTEKAEKVKAIYEQDTISEKKNSPLTFSNFASKARLFSSKSKTDEQEIEVKTKIRSMWNSMKYGWRMKREVKLKVDSPVWLLGQYYHAKLQDIPCNHSAVGSKALSMEDIAKDRFKQDVTSRIWLTYRVNFPKIPGTDFATDSGWGCMLRAGQMMMAQALVCHFLSRAWRLSSVQTERTITLHRMIIRWFGDSLSTKSPFSVHHLVSLGKMYGRKIGDWYGPTHAAHVLRKALIQARNNDHRLDNICMYAASDGIVFKQDIVDLCINPLETSPNGSSVEYSFPSTSTNSYEKCNKQSINEKKTLQTEDKSKSELNTECIPTKHLDNTRTYSLSSEYNMSSSLRLRHLSECEEASEHFANGMENLPTYSECVSEVNLMPNSKWRSLILFVSVRLGNDKINPFYIPSLKSLLAYEHCIGIIGGRPKHAVYFIGWQDEKLIHLDPHSCQPAVDVEKDDFNEKTFHSSSVRTMSFTEMDPSCAIGFYFRTRDEFEYFSEKISEIASPLKKNLDYPLFALAEGRRVEVEEMNSKHCSYAIQPSNLRNDSYKEEDDYILL